MIDSIALLINLGGLLVMLMVTYAIGTMLERNHFKQIRAREQDLQSMIAITFRRLPQDWNATEAGLVVGSVVVSLDYFKRFLAGLRAVVGGNIKAYEPLLDRARREAMLRMKEQAREKGYDAVINVRMESARIASTKRQGKRTAGVEMLVYGTGIKRMG